MCEFCTQHGEGKKWYENASNYGEEVFHEVTSRRKLTSFLEGLYHSLKVDTERAHLWKRRLPRIYEAIAFPLVTRRLKKVHFGQIVPIEDVEKVLDLCGSIVRLPCVCRRVTTGDGERYCFGIGVDLTQVYADLPDYSDFEVMTPGEAKALVRKFDGEGMTHSVWTLSTPFIGGLCNCDRNCMAYRFQVGLGLGKAMWKAEYIAAVDPLRCGGCRECLKRCYFDALSYDRRNGKCVVDPLHCYGCGICRAVCKHGAIDLFERSETMAAALW